jgi:hypothetical protein
MANDSLQGPYINFRSMAQLSNCKYQDGKRDSSNRWSLASLSILRDHNS